MNMLLSSQLFPSFQDVQLRAWMTLELLQAIKEKKAKRCAAKTTSAVDIALYKKLKKTTIHEDKLHY